MKKIETDCNRLKKIEQDWQRLNKIEQDWTRLNKSEQEWTRLSAPSVNACSALLQRSAPAGVSAPMAESGRVDRIKEKDMPLKNQKSEI